MVQKEKAKVKEGNLQLAIDSLRKEV